MVVLSINSPHSSYTKGQQLHKKGDSLVETGRNNSVIHTKYRNRMEVTRTVRPSQACIRGLHRGGAASFGFRFHWSSRSKKHETSRSLK